jgi:hypothetical protein
VKAARKRMGGGQGLENRKNIENKLKKLASKIFTGVMFLGVGFVWIQ